MIRDTFTVNDKREADDLFALLMPPLCSLSSKSWSGFSQLRQLRCTVPSNGKIGGVMLDTTYKSTRAKTFAAQRNEGGSTLGIDGATNALSKSICNVTMHTPFASFTENPRSALTRETTPNIVSKTTDLLTRMESELGFCCRSFISD